jgi:hypothetical protein
VICPTDGSRLRRVDEHEGDAARLLTAIHKGVVRGLLDHNIAGLDSPALRWISPSSSSMSIVAVEQHNGLAAVVDCRDDAADIFAESHFVSPSAGHVPDFSV